MSPKPAPAKIFLMIMIITASTTNLLLIEPDPVGGLTLEDFGGWTLVGRDEYITITGQTGSTGFGGSLAAGDLDGDGRDDIIVGIPTYLGNGASGAVLVFFARDQADISPLRSLENADVIIYGADPGDRFGANLAAGDMNGDGREELLISAPDAFGMNNGKRSSGEVYILEGRSRSQFPSRMWIDSIGLFGHIYGRDPMDQIGLRMVMGDLTGDGLEELALGTNGAGGFAGNPPEYHGAYENNAPGSWEIEVIEGSSTPIGNLELESDIKMVRYFSSWNSTETPPDTHAMSIGRGMDIIDINGDGTGDLVFSWSRWEAKDFKSTQLEVISGGPSFPHLPINTTVDIIIPTFSPNMTIEFNDTLPIPPLLYGGYFDNDPNEDLVFGDPNGYDSTGRRPDAGRVNLIRGFNHTNGQTIYSNSIVSTIYGEDSSDFLGTSMTCSDLDNDGMDELLIGAPSADGGRNLLSGCGEGYRFDIDGTYLPSIEVTDATERFMGMFEGMGSFSVITSSSIDNDGNNEILTSSPGFLSDDGVTKVGLISLFMDKREFETRIYGSTDSSAFGKVSLIDDLDNDGYNDIVIGDPQAYTAQDGGAYLFFGGPSGWDNVLDIDSDANIIYKVDLEGNQAHLGHSITSGYLNNDAYPDLVIGGPQYYDGMNNCGSFQVFWGGTRTYMEQMNNKQVLGQSVEGVGSALTVGDFNGDGSDDLAVSAISTTASQSLNRYHAGNVYIYFGPLTAADGRINTANVRISGSIANEQIGETLKSGDIDDDGYDELIIGAPRSDLGSVTDQGLVYIMKGRSTWASTYDLAVDDPVRIFGPWPFDQIGTSLAVGDLDGDDRDDLAIGSPNSDGFQRTVPQAGNVHILLGSYLSGMLGGSNISLRTQHNISIAGESINEKFGTSIAMGDIEGTGNKDLLIGATGWRGPSAGSPSGGLKILSSRMIRDGGRLNSSSLIVISSKGDSDLFGTSITVGSLGGDPSDDLLIGAPAHDPYGNGEIMGGVFLWEGKNLYFRDISVSAARILATEGVEDPGGIMGEVQYLSPRKGPYLMRVTGRSVSGYEDIGSIEVSMDSLGGFGSANLIFRTSTRSFSILTTGIFEDKIWLDQGTSLGTTDSVESWFVDFAFYVDWNMPDPDVLTTRIEGGSSGYTNYLSKEFRVDRTIHMKEEGIVISDGNGDPVDGWLNSTSELKTGNITLYHVINGEIIEGEALDMISLGLYRPDGILIGQTYRNGSELAFNTTLIGEGLNGASSKFTIGPDLDDPLPGGSLWGGDASFTLKTDTSPPPEVSSFQIFPDGKEKGILETDDDRFVEVYWQTIFDIGPSGIDRYVLEVLGNGSEIISIQDPVSTGELITIPEGSSVLRLTAYDNAGNAGPPIERSIQADTERPFFWGADPRDDSWLNEETDELNIRVWDGGSGIDTDSASYRLFHAGSDVLSEWTSVLGWEEMGGGEIRLVAPVHIDEGYGHYVQWRVSDTVGQVSVSQPYSFHVDRTPPTIDIGENQLTIGPGPLTLQCFLEDQLSWLNLSTAEFKMGASSDFQEANWYDLDLQGFRVSASPSIEIDPDFEGVGFAQWKVADRAGNLVESDLITLYVDRTLPEFIGFEPNESVIQTEMDVEVSAEIVERGSGLLFEDVEVSISTISGWVKYGVGGYSPWVPIEDLSEVVDSYLATATVKLDEGPFNLVRFRVRDQAGNGWVVSRSIKVNVDLPDVNLPPSSLFNMVPVADMIFLGESIILDGSPSLDPEGQNLTFNWFSDLEEYPGTGDLGSGITINVTLSTIGVHNIWLIVSDGIHTVRSENLQLRVVDVDAPETDGGGEERGILDILKDALLYLLLALLVGLIIGAAATYLIWGARGPRGPVMEEPKLVDAVYESEHIIPYCPYCHEEARVNDEYCVKCGAIFTEKDKTDMLSGKKGKKRRRKESLKAAPEGVEEEWDIPMEEEITGELFADEPEEIDEEDLDLEEYEEEEIEEITEMDIDEIEEELDEIEDDDEWEVEE